MSDGEAWLDALSEQLRETEEGIPVLATAQSELQGVNVSSISAFQAKVLGWHTAVANAARAVLGARLSRAAPVFANAMAWASKLRDEVAQLDGVLQAESAPAASAVPAGTEAPAASEASGSQSRANWAGVGAVLAEAGARASEVAAAKAAVGHRLTIGTAIISEAAGLIGQEPEALLAGSAAR